MRLYQQLVLFTLGITVVPLALMGFFLLRRSEDALARRIGLEQSALAQVAAEGVEADLMSAIEGVSRSAALVDWDTATAQELRGALTLLYQQSPLIGAVALARPATAPSDALQIFSREAAQGHPAYRERPGVPLASAVTVRGSGDWPRGHVSRSESYRSGAGGMALAVAVKLADGEKAPFAVVELSLAGVEESLTRRSTGGVRLVLVEEGGRVVAGRVEGVPDGVLAGAWPRLSGKAAGVLRLKGEGGQALQVAASPVAPLALWVVAWVPEAEALGPVLALRWTVLGSVGAVLLLCLGLALVFTRRLNARLSAVARGAEAYSRGELAHRVEVTGADELAELGAVFNRMGVELEAAREKLSRWNEELAARVEQATAELRAAQAQLLEAQKLAAIGQLGAGVAHEINNPLCGILGNTQLLLLERAEGDSDFEMLKKIEQAAKRCRDITQALLRFAQAQAKAAVRPVDLNSVVRDALGPVEAAASAEGLSLHVALHEGGLRVQGDPGQLLQVMQAVLANARTALAGSARRVLEVRTRQEGSLAELLVRDTGKGIKAEHLPRIFEPFFTTKDVWSNVGLGLSLAYRIVSDHHGSIDVSSKEGEGTQVIVRLPVAPQGAQPTVARGGPFSAGGQGTGIVG